MTVLFSSKPETCNISKSCYTRFKYFWQGALKVTSSFPRPPKTILADWSCWQVESYKDALLSTRGIKIWIETVYREFTAFGQFSKAHVTCFSLCLTGKAAAQALSCHHTAQKIAIKKINPRRICSVTVQELLQRFQDAQKQTIEKTI